MSRSRGSRRAASYACALLACFAACAEVDNPAVAPPNMGLDEKVFRCSVEPVLVRQCSYSACHGIAGSALRIYSPGKLRAATPANLDAAIVALTEAEHHANFLSASGFRFGAADPLDNLLVRKTLPATDGGYAHEGGAIFSGTGDAQWIAIEAWIAGTGKCP
ncbi:MAG: hypothetical protein IPQ07_40735 [Myxococcales bacterium]|nr:hypothetical protein [Myxococcales bacterium]